MPGLFGYPDTFHSPRVIGKSKRQVRLTCVLLRRAGMSARVAVIFALVPLGSGALTVNA